MFAPDRDSQLSKVVWNADRSNNPNREDLSYYVDFCKYAGSNEVADGENWYEGWIDDIVGNSRQEGLGYSKIAQWLRHEVSRAYHVSYPWGIETIHFVIIRSMADERSFPKDITGSIGISQLIYIQRDDKFLIAWRVIMHL